jgi:hypothetical protein
MTIEPAFQIGLGIYGIDADVRSMRREIWELIKPHLGQIYIWIAVFDHTQTRHTQRPRPVRLSVRE